MIDAGYDILNAIDDGALIINRDYEIIFANHSFLRLHQSTSGNILGEKCYTISHKCSVPCLEKCTLKKVFEEGSSVSHEHHHFFADGTKRFFQISASPLKNDQGETVHMLQILKDVTEQHQQKMALGTSHLELERIFNSAPFTISYLDLEMRVLRLNPAMEKFINRTTAEVKGQYCYDIWGQYAKDETRKERKRICDSCRSQDALRDGKHYVYERQLGDTYFEIMSVPVFDYTNSIIGVMEIGTDITERKLAEEALFHERNNFKNILNSMGDGVYIVNADYDIEYVNTVINEQFGEIQGRKCFAYFHDRNEACTWCKNPEVLQGKTVRWEWFSPKTRKTYDFIDTPLKNPDGTLSKLEIFRDITARKQLERVLQKSKDEWERTFDSIPDIVALQDTDLRIVKINQMGCDTLGLAYNAIIGHHCYELFHGGKDPCVLCPLLQTKRDFQPYSREMHHEKLDKTFLVSAAPVLDEHGKLEYIVHIAKDVTDQKKLQRESDQRLQQIIQANKLASLGEVVAGVAHEINNPNSFISYNIPLLEDIWHVLQSRVDKHGTTSTEETLGNVSVNELCQDMDEIIEAIKLGSDRINRVVDNLKDFSRLDATSHSEAVQLNEMIEKTYSIVGAQVRRTAYSIEFHLAKELPLVMGHFQKLEQIIANLLINAAHALQKNNRGKINVSTGFIERLDSLVVTVEDNGIGMDSDTMERIFDPFFTTRRDCGGTGLGLSVSYGLVREHAGTLAVLSQPGIGTRFTLLLPREQTRKPLELTPAILLIDDEEESLSNLGALLQESTDSAILTLNDRENLISFLEEYPEVDIIFSPLRSSHINGWEILEEIKKHFPLMAVFLYAEKNEEYGGKPTSFTPDRVLQKPFNITQIRDCISSTNRTIY